MVVLGTELKINVHIEPMNNIHMSDYDFVCEFYTNQSKRVIIKKEEMKKVDDDNYIAMIDENNARKIGKGKIMLHITAYIPDGDFSDGLRTEKAVVWTGVTVV